VPDIVRGRHALSLTPQQDSINPKLALKLRPTRYWLRALRC
jgi:hypothetical protein